MSTLCNHSWRLIPRTVPSMRDTDTQEDRPSVRTFCQPMVSVVWLSRLRGYLLRRKDAARLREVAALSSHPRDVVTLTPRPRHATAPP